MILSTQQPNVSPERHLQTFRLPGNIFTHTITGLYKDTVYNVSVAAGTVHGFTGPSAWKVINTGEGRVFASASPLHSLHPLVYVPLYYIDY